MYKITYNNLYVFFVHMYTVNPTFNQQALLRFNWHTTQCYIAMDQLHVKPKKINYSRLHMMSYPNYYWLAPLGLLPLISMGKYIKIDSFEAKCNGYVYVLLPEQQDTKILCAFKRTTI